MSSADLPASASEMLPLVYSELRVVARNYLRRERKEHTLQPTALVHEAYLRLRRHAPDRWESPAQFCAAAAVVMRRVLVDHARARLAKKRGGGKAWNTTLEGLRISVDDRLEDVLAVDQALQQLAKLDPLGARVVELRFFGGLTEPEIAAELSYSERWIRQKWVFAKAWLRRAMEGAGEAD